MTYLEENYISGALSVSDFCKAYNIGRTFFYEQIKLGHLSAHKAGNKTLILRDEADRWVRSLPKLGGVQ